MVETFEEMMRIAEAEGDYALDLVRRQQVAARERLERAVVELAALESAEVAAGDIPGVVLSFMPNEEPIERGRKPPRDR